jgi:hypothetical protein
MEVRILINDIAIESGGANLPTNGWGLVLTFNLVVEFFQELRKN